MIGEPWLPEVVVWDVWLGLSLITSLAVSVCAQAASQTRDKSVLTEEGVGRVLDQLRKDFDFVVCDSPAGIEQGKLVLFCFVACVEGS